MPTFLERDPDVPCLTVRLVGLQGAEFSDQLTRVKSIPGRRPAFDDETGKFKRWELRDDADTALRAMQMLEPIASAEVQHMVREAAAVQADDLVTKIGDDAELQWERAGDLWPFQRAGIAWMLEHPQCILADEMGLGKTIEAIGLLAEARTLEGEPGELVANLDGPALVICPNSVRGSWQDEAAEWAKLDAQIIDGKTPAIRRKQMNRDAPYFVTNWEKLQERVGLVAELAKRSGSEVEPWSAIFADEAHRAKKGGPRGSESQQALGLWKLRAPIELAMSGTPVMNSPDELYSLLHWQHPKHYTSFWTFHNSYVDEYTAGKNMRVMIGVKNADDLRFELSDKLIRRTKKQVLPDLPDKLPVQTLELAMLPKQQRLYDEAETAFFLDVGKYLAEDFVPDPDGGGLDALREQIEKAIDAGDTRRIELLIKNGGVRTTRLRQIAASPVLVDGPDESATFDAIVEDVRDNPGKPFVIFAWHQKAVQALVDRLEKGKPALRVGRLMGNDDAHAVTDAFQAGDLDIIVSSIAKGGTGLTWTRADTALFAEEDWVPDINKQAEDRLHRIGQKSAVTIRRYRSAGTVQTGRIANAQRAKEIIRDAVLGSDA